MIKKYILSSIHLHSIASTLLKYYSRRTYFSQKYDPKWILCQMRIFLKLIYHIYWQGRIQKKIMSSLRFIKVTPPLTIIDADESKMLCFSTKFKVGLSKHLHLTLIMKIYQSKLTNQNILHNERLFDRVYK